MKTNLLFTFLLIGSSVFAQYNFEQIEIDPNDDAFAEGFVEYNGELYFTANGQNSGFELWKTDGSVATLVKDINTSGDSFPRRLTVLNNTLFFSANDGVHGRELWKTDGTSDGTVMVKDILTGAGNGLNTSRNPFLIYNNSIVFVAQEPGVGNVFLHSSDGTLSGTAPLATNVKCLFNRLDAAVLGDDIYFEGENVSGANLGRELWRYSDATMSAALLKDIASGPADSDISEFILFNNELYFSADNGSIGDELWKTDGTSVGTVLVKDINPGSNRGFSNYARFQEFKGYLYFSANDGTHGRELWRTDGTEMGTTLFIDINPTANQSGIEETDITQQLFFVHNNKMYFKASNTYSASNQPNNTEPWETDGMASGTQMVADLNPNGSSMNDYNSFIVYDNTLLFTALDFSNPTNYDLYAYDFINPPTIIEPENTTDADVAGDFYRPFVFGNSLYITADYFINGFSNGVQLWKVTSSTLSLEGLNSGISFQLHPNPTRDILNISSNSQIEKIEVFNYLGQNVITTTKNKIDISQLTVGHYVLRIFSGKKIVSKKFIKY